MILMMHISAASSFCFHLVLQRRSGWRFLGWLVNHQGQHPPWRKQLPALPGLPWDHLKHRPPCWEGKELSESRRPEKLSPLTSCPMMKITSMSQCFWYFASFRILSSFYWQITFWSTSKGFSIKVADNQSLKELLCLPHICKAAVWVSVDLRSNGFHFFEQEACFEATI